MQTSHMILSIINFMISGWAYLCAKEIGKKIILFKMQLFFFKSCFNNVLAFIKHTIVKIIVIFYEKVP